jgi:hypothetical protein
MATPELEPRDPEPPVEDAEDSRDGWLSLALSDLGGGAGALATAARGGRSLPRREEPQE